MATQLSDFDFHVLSMFVGSMTDREIAFAMDADSEEIKSAFSRIMEHFGADDIDEASKSAVQKGIISLDI